MLNPETKLTPQASKKTPNDGKNPDSFTNWGNTKQPAPMVLLASNREAEATAKREEGDSVFVDAVCMDGIENCGVAQKESLSREKDEEEEEEKVPVDVTGDINVDGVVDGVGMALVIVFGVVG